MTNLPALISATVSSMESNVGAGADDDDEVDGDMPRKESSGGGNPESMEGKEKKSKR